MNRIKYFLINFIIIILFLLDISLKKIFSTGNREYFVFLDWVKLSHAFNPGIAFGLPINYYLIVLFYIIIIPFLLWFLFFSYKNKNTINIIGITLIIFGAISNLIDRIAFGGVIDYLNIKYWSILNIADIMIVSGITLIIYFSLKRN